MAIKLVKLAALNSLLCSLVLVPISYSLFKSISGLEKFVESINLLYDHKNKSADKPEIQSTKLDLGDFSALIWDADVNYTLALALTNQAYSFASPGLRQISLSKAQLLLDNAGHYSPVNLNVVLLNLSILIDQGAPIDYLLPRIDRLIELVPKDQDLKSEIARLCFQLAAIYDDPASRLQLIDRLNKLFAFSMDYRGIRQIHRYASLFNQKDLLAKLSTDGAN